MSAATSEQVVQESLIPLVSEEAHFISLTLGREVKLEIRHAGCLGPDELIDPLVLSNRVSYITDPRGARIVHGCALILPFLQVRYHWDPRFDIHPPESVHGLA